MFITDELNPGELLAELLKGRRVSSDDTAEFAALRHDRDLCPGFKTRLSAMLDVYAAYRQDAHDIQGMRDDGVDVLLTYRDADGMDRRAGLQIKSDDEFDKWASKKLELMMKLKGQYASAMQNARIDDYYVVLCVDETKHRKRIRMLASELKNFGHCTIIEPREAMGFLDMTETAVVARTTRLLCRDDKVLNAAIAEADREEPDVAYFMVALVCRAMEGRGEVADEDLAVLWSDWCELHAGATGDSRLGRVVSELTGSGVLDESLPAYKIQIENLPVAICACSSITRCGGIPGRAAYSQP